MNSLSVGLTRYVRGRVIDDKTGDPVPNISVRARDKDDFNPDDDMGGWHSTDANGNYNIGYPGKKYDSKWLSNGRWRPDIFVETDDPSEKYEDGRSATHNNHVMKNVLYVADIRLKTKKKKSGWDKFVDGVKKVGKEAWDGVKKVGSVFKNAGETGWDAIKKIGKFLKTATLYSIAFFIGVAMVVGSFVALLITGSMPIYGQYCGPGHGDETYEAPGIDAVDEACRIHDMCYGQEGYFSCECDLELLENLVPAIKAEQANGNWLGVAAGEMIITWFSVQTELECIIS